jgi:NADH-quinone oxidoreductase subunit G
LRGGDAGVRLFEPSPRNGQAYFSAIPASFQPRESEWLLVPMYHIFGSDELSLQAPAIRELAVMPYVAINSDEFADGMEVEVTLSDGTFRLPVRIHREMPAGVAAVSTGSSPFVGLQMPGWAKIARAK